MGVAKEAAGLLVYRRTNDAIEVLLVHPGGPIWGGKDFWSIPKGELDPGEDHLDAANREFREELGLDAPKGDLLDLGSILQRNNKTNFIWAVEGDVDVSLVVCEEFEMEWPPKSGRMQSFPENDRADWFDLAEARAKVFEPQREFFDRLATQLKIDLEPYAEPQQTLL